MEAKLYDEELETISIKPQISYLCFYRSFDQAKPLLVTTD
jgi:hypothetical protein